MNVLMTIAAVLLLAIATAPLWKRNRVVVGEHPDLARVRLLQDIADSGGATFVVGVDASMGAGAGAATAGR